MTPYAWSISSGILPAGLNLNASTGVIYGNVGNSAVTETFTVTLTDADNVTAAKNFTITVNSMPSITTSSPLRTATASQNGYSQTLAETGGATPFTWSVTSGILPAGLNLNASTGVISGNVSNSAVSENFTVTLTDANNVSATKSFTITVNSVPVIAPTSLPSVAKGGSYSQNLTVSGGTTPFGSWSISSGTLPTGLSLNSSTGVISGTSTQKKTGTSTFTVQITDANGVIASQSLSIQVT